MTVVVTLLAIVVAVLVILVAGLLALATGDLGFTDAGRARRRKARPDAERESDIDAALLAAGVLPGDERLYRPLDEPADDQP